MRTLWAVSVLMVTGCANQFELTGTTFVGAHSSTHVMGARQVLETCGEFRTIPGATDTGGTACLDVEFVAAQVSALTLPATLTINGSAVAGTPVTFSPTGTNSPSVISAWLGFNCFCPNPTAETLTGTLTLRTADANHLAGELNVTVYQEYSATNRPTQTVHAVFDATN